MSDFYKDLEDFLSQRANRTDDERLIKLSARVASMVAKDVVDELFATQSRSNAMIRYRPDYDRGSRNQAMIRYRPDYDRGARNQAMIRYRPDYDRGARNQAMIRYRPDYDRGARNQAMIRYRPDYDRGARNQAMIRYRPDYDRGARNQAMIRYRPDYDRSNEVRSAESVLKDFENFASDVMNFVGIDELKETFTKVIEQLSDEETNNKSED